MTIDEKVEAFRMRLEGSTLEEIANHFGVSKQYISQELTIERERKRSISAKCIYPNLKNFMRQNRLTGKSFAKKTGICYPTLCRVLSGETDAHKKTIDRILEYTGFSYDQAFSRE